MKRHQRLILSGTGALLALTAVALILTRSWSGGPAKPRSKNSAPQLVDERPLETAQRLAPLAVTAEEKQYAAEALRLGDHEVDLAFNHALRNAARETVPSSPEIQQLEARVKQFQGRVDSGQANVARLQGLLAKAPPSKKDELQQGLQLAQAQLDLDQDELDDAHRDLQRAGGDPQAKIQQMLEEHEHSEVHKGDDSTNESAKEAAIENTTARNVLAESRAWHALSAKQLALDSARSDASGYAATLAQSHENLEQQIAPQENTPAQTAAPSRSQPAPQTASSAAAANPAPFTDATASQQISRVHRLTEDQKTLSGYDKRIEDERALADNYSQWSAFVVARERVFLHELLESAFWVVLILFLAVLSDVVLRHFLPKLRSDHKQLLTIRSVLVVTIRTVGAVLILLILLGTPSQFATVLALAGAGLTVALKDFIVGFFGWFVLMGRNGIRPGDWVEINGVAGEVFEVGLLHTVLLETGNWSDAGHPTGRKVTFVNSFAIEGHYFNFSTSGQWMWDEIEVTIPANKNPYPIAEEIKSMTEKATEANARLAEKEFERATISHNAQGFSAAPALNIRPSGEGAVIAVRYITQANERHELRSQLYSQILQLLHRKKIPKAEEKLAPQAALEAE